MQDPDGGERGVTLDLSNRIRRQVPAEVATRLSHPHYWAPFVLIGNGL